MSERLSGVNVQSPENILAADIVSRYVSHIPIEISGKPHLVRAIDYASGGGNVVVIFNHTHILDPVVLGELTRRQIGNDKPFREVVFASGKFYKHLYQDVMNDPALLSDSSIQAGIAAHRQSRMDVAGRILHTIAHRAHVTILPMVQKAHLGEGKFRRHNLKQIDKKSFEEVEDIMELGGTVVGLSPEGTRSKDGALRPAEDGWWRLFRTPNIKNNTLILPMAIQNMKRGLQNMFSPIYVSTGPLVSSMDIEIEYNQHVTEQGQYDMRLVDFAMMRVAALLPDVQRGHYADAKFAPYIQEVHNAMFPRQADIFPAVQP